jgi:hypothetical protein
MYFFPLLIDPKYYLCECCNFLKNLEPKMGIFKEVLFLGPNPNFIEEKMGFGSILAKGSKYKLICNPILLECKIGLKLCKLATVGL